MDSLNKIDLLAARAKNQKTSTFLVSDHVMQQIQFKQKKGFDFFAFDMFAAVSAVAASILLIIGIHCWSNMTGPLAQLYTPLSGASLW